MDMLEIAQELIEIAEEKAKETGRTTEEIWLEVTKELENIYNKSDLKKGVSCRIQRLYERDIRQRKV